LCIRIVAEADKCIVRIRLRKRTNGSVHLQKKVQHGDDLGARMAKAFQEIFLLKDMNGFVGCCYELTSDINGKAFLAKETNETVIVPHLMAIIYWE
jgi:hypothetical protein